MKENKPPYTDPENWLHNEADLNFKLLFVFLHTKAGRYKADDFIWVDFFFSISFSFVLDFG